MFQKQHKYMYRAVLPVDQPIARPLPEHRINRHKQPYLEWNPCECLSGGRQRSHSSGRVSALRQKWKIPSTTVWLIHHNLDCNWKASSSCLQTSIVCGHKHQALNSLLPVLSCTLVLRYGGTESRTGTARRLIFINKTSSINSWVPCCSCFPGWMLETICSRNARISFSMLLFARDPYDCVLNMRLEKGISVWGVGFLLFVKIIKNHLINIKTFHLMIFILKFISILVLIIECLGYGRKYA
jgi:hypothetical protein